jgi:hypothetical protein
MIIYHISILYAHLSFTQMTLAQDAAYSFPLDFG